MKKILIFIAAIFQITVLLGKPFTDPSDVRTLTDEKLINSLLCVFFKAEQLPVHPTPQEKIRSQNTMAIFDRQLDEFFRRYRDCKNDMTDVEKQQLSLFKKK